MISPHESVLVLDRYGHKKVDVNTLDYLPEDASKAPSHVVGTYTGPLPQLDGCRALLKPGTDRFNRPIYYCQFNDNICYLGVNLAGRWHEFHRNDWRL